MNFRMLVMSSGAMALSACATMEGYQGAAGGCAAGAILVGIMGGQAEDMAAGCAVGAVAGGVAGDYLGERRQAYASTEAFYSSEIALIEQANAALVSDIEEQERQIAQLAATNAALRSEGIEQAELGTALAAQRSAVSGQISDLETQIAAVELQIANSRTVVAAMREDKALEEAERLENALGIMTANLDQLRGNYRELNDIQSVMAL
ncbi:hypothetical protein GCM10007420_22100 [Glycocaulis albus]|uniref:Glycine zipper domain-containing protein n=1 Tax=Glycocaulis albus TaxID=1382801 RepID=A0ABQ1XW97_9PROT|nr:hypothetical protein [Glycocaulis albus]GGH05204.1 hypothetical protein GCM10007420_22100 [Glycocaulis albus]